MNELYFENFMVQNAAIVHLYRDPYAEVSELWLCYHRDESRAKWY